jgi:hypothetical protein
MATVRVDRHQARERGLPLVSVRSGAPADGFVKAGRPPYVIQVPLTQDEFDMARSLESRRRTAIWGGVACAAVGVSMSRFPVLLPLGLLIGLLSAGLWGVIWLQLRRLLPVVEAGPGSAEFTLSGVHKDFAAAVAEVPD